MRCEGRRDDARGTPDICRLRTEMEAGECRADCFMERDDDLGDGILSAC